ncbi:MAG: ATP-binding protein [Comamonadaceae bacterium]|nr:ATP-binding protein [Comamonadaceae bacterium]
MPVVDLPLGATEDRVVGALDLERALTQGVKAFEPGLLARAHRGFLYIDEVNLLEDHLVDLLLDVAASGENVVEREGLSVRHPARFVLVGSGNPEEGELRPQLLDRFGLSVEVKTPTDLAQRIEVDPPARRLRARPGGLRRRTGTRRTTSVRRRIVAARERLGEVQVSDAALEQATRSCACKLGTDGLRGELTLMRAARALAALDRRPRTSAPISCGGWRPSALRHRLRRNVLDDAGSIVARGARAGRAVRRGLSRRCRPRATPTRPAATPSDRAGATRSAAPRCSPSIRWAWAACALRAGAGPVRDRWLARWRSAAGASAPLRRVPLAHRRRAACSAGSIWPPRCRRAGRSPSAACWPTADGGVLLLPMAERLPPETAARLAAVMDSGEVRARARRRRRCRRRPGSA